MKQIYTLEQLIHDHGQIPMCSCPECQLNGTKVNIHPNRSGSYVNYKHIGYPKFIRGHYVKVNPPNKDKPMCQEQRDKISKSRKEFYKIHPEAKLFGKDNPMFGIRGNKHPNFGILISDEQKEILRLANIGKTIPSETKLKMREAQLAEKNHFFGKHHTSESIELIKQNQPSFSGTKNPMYGKPPTHGTKIYQHYNSSQGLLLMHRWDRLLAKYYDTNNIKYLYESKIFHIPVDGKDMNYTPDFYLPETDEYIEVKGYFRGSSRLKFESFKQQYPHLKIQLLMREDLLKLGINLNFTPEERQLLDEYKRIRNLKNKI